MDVRIAKPPRGYTRAQWAEVERRLDALVAECQADEDVGRRLALAWLAGRTHAETSLEWYCTATCDGRSAYLGGDCHATWQPGPRRLYDPEVALINGRRLMTGRFDIRAHYGFVAVLEERFVPYVLVRTPYPHTSAYEPQQLVDGWNASQAVVRLLETRAHEAAVREIVWGWVHDDPEPSFRIDRHHCDIMGGYDQRTDLAVYANLTCLLAWAAEPLAGRRVALLSARRYPHRTFTRLIRDEIRSALRAHDVPVFEVTPQCPHRYVADWNLREAWAAGRMTLR